MAKLPKKPKKPKKSAPLSTWENYDERYKAWQKKINDKKNGARKKESLIKKYT